MVLLQEGLWEPVARRWECAAAATAQGFRNAAITAKASRLGAYAGQVSTFSASAADMAYERAKSQGVSDDEAKSYALKQGVIEGGITTLFNVVGAGAVEKMVANGFSRRIVRGC